MKNSIFKILLLFFITAYSISSVSAQNSKAPDFNLFDTNGKILRLSKQLGQVVVLNFFNFNYPSCIKEIKDLLELKKYFDDKKTQFIGIICDNEINVEKLKEFRMTNKINYKLLYATDSVIMDYDGIKVIPSTFIIDKKGFIVEHFLGYIAYDQLKLKLEKYLNLEAMKMQ